MVYRNSLRRVKLVNTLLDFSRIEAGRVEATYEPTDLAMLTREVASTFRSAIQKAGMELRADCPPLDQPVYVDLAMFEKIVLNLLSNAFKFTFHGWIEVALRPSGSSVELTVSDSGVGIPARDLPHVFDRFHRVKGVQGRTYEGTGIGLALVQELVKLHGGAVRVESVAGTGSTFTVSIPFGTAHLPADRVNASRSQTQEISLTSYLEETSRWLPEPVPGFVEAADARPTTADPDCRAQRAEIRVLLADDNADMREYVGRLLSAHYHVEAVADGAAAIAAVMRQKPDLILSDVMMPGVDGVGFLRQIRSDEATRDVPFILLSARAGEESRIEGLDVGADDYLIKPFGARELLARVGAQIKLARMRREDADERYRLREETLRSSEAEFRAMFELTSVGMTQHDPETGRFVRVNETFAQMTGYDQAELLDMSFLDLTHPHDRRANWEAFARLVRGEVQTYQVEKRFVRKDGVILWGHVTVNVVRDAEGRPRTTVAVVHDLTERRLAEQSLRESEERFRKTFDHAATGIAITNLDGQFVRCNP
ncbi:MAG: PAS domain S-box protein, partial [Vicinamibacterales bacterium]